MSPQESRIKELQVPAPFFSGKVPSQAPTPISFAPTTIDLATPMTHGILMAEFDANPQALRNPDDTFLPERFDYLILTWPGINWEWKASMSNIAEGRSHFSRVELAQFVVKQFKLFASAMSATPQPNTEWRLGDAPNAYNAKNTSLAFLFSPAPLTWQASLRVRLHSGSSAFESAPEPPPDVPLHSGHSGSCALESTL